MAAAAVAAAGWRPASLSQRSVVLFAFRELLHARSGELAEIMAEQGNVLADATGAIARGLENVEFAIGLPHLLEGSFSEVVSTGVDVASIRQPLGVGLSRKALPQAMALAHMPGARWSGPDGDPATSSVDLGSLGPAEGDLAPTVPNSTIMRGAERPATICRLG